MPNNVRELFEELGSNQYVKTHILDGMDFKYSSDDIAEIITYDDMIMPVLKASVSNENIILDKLKIFVGQQVKKITNEQVKAQTETQSQQQIEEPTQKPNVSIEITEDDLFKSDFEE
jgi:hypothetical protein